MFDTLFDTNGNWSSLLGKEKYANRLQVIFRQQIQPWHPSSTLVHEAALAVLKLHPTSFYSFSHGLFQHQKEYFDVNVVNESRNQTYKRLSELAEEKTGIEARSLYELLEVSSEPDKEGGLNTGNKVTDDLKRLVKAARMTGVHVTPTAVWDGVVESSISSSWTLSQWEEFLDEKLGLKGKDA
jgi:protein-disulfide isomerase